MVGWLRARRPVARLLRPDDRRRLSGRRVNGAFSLAQSLLVGGSSLPAVAKTCAGPVSNDAVTIEFRQSIGASEPLRRGAYAKTLAFTLSTTSP